MSELLSVDTVLLRRAAGSLRQTAEQWRVGLPDPLGLPPVPMGPTAAGGAVAVEAVSLVARRLRSALATAVALAQIADHHAGLLETAASSFEATG